MLGADVMPGVDGEPVGSPLPELGSGDEPGRLLGVWDGLPDCPPSGVFEGPLGCPLPDVGVVLPGCFEVEREEGGSGIDGPEALLVVPLTLPVPL